MPGRNPKAPPRGPREALPVSALPASLVGTITSTAPDWSLALIALAGEPRAAPFRPGDRLAADARLVSVHADRVVIEHAGRLEQLRLADTVGPLPGVVVASADPLASPAAGGWVQRVGDDQYRLDRERFTQILAHPESLAHEARISLSFGAGGKVDGVRLLAVRPNGLLSQLGLGRSDVIRRVNGAPLDGPDRMLEIVTGLRSTHEVELEIASGGHTRNIHYQID